MMTHKISSYHCMGKRVANLVRMWIFLINRYNIFRCMALDDKIRSFSSYLDCYC